MEDFISAFNYTALNNSDTQREANGWIGRFTRAYKNYYGVQLRIPQWIDIAGKYDLSNQHDYEKKCKERNEKELKLTKEIGRLNRITSGLKSVNPQTKKAALLREQLARAEGRKEQLNNAIGVLADDIDRLEKVLNLR